MPTEPEEPELPTAPDPPRPLDYREAQKTPSPRAAAGLFTVGLICGIVIIVLGGCGVFNAVGYPLIAGRPPASPPPVKWWAPDLFFFIAAGSGLGIIGAFKAQARRWFVLGLLFGVGSMCLIEGFCFMNP